MYMIKQKFEDFIVRENMNLNFGSGRYVYFKLIKRNWNSMDAIKEIGRKLGIKLTSFGFAGLKDKNALTEQYVSVADVKEDRLAGVSLDGLNIEVLGRGNERISLGSLNTNSFEIVVRNLDNENELGAEKLENYFDEQRFSSNNFEIGRSLIKRDFNRACSLMGLDVLGNDFVGALRWVDKRLLKLYIGAYQGYLFNLGLSEYLIRSCVKITEVDYSLGKFVFGDRFFDIKIPLVNFDSVFDNELIDFYRNLLTNEKISLRDFVIREIPELVSEGVSRAGFVDVSDFKYSYNWDEMNEGKLKCKLEFSLPKGAYGSLLVKKLFRIS